MIERGRAERKWLEECGHIICKAMANGLGEPYSGFSWVNLQLRKKPRGKEAKEFYKKARAAQQPAHT